MMGYGDCCYCESPDHLSASCPAKKDTIRSTEPRKFKGDTGKRIALAGCCYCESPDHLSASCPAKKDTIRSTEPRTFKGDTGKRIAPADPTESTEVRTPVEIENRNEAGENFGRLEKLSVKISDPSFGQKGIDSFQDAGIDQNILKVLVKLKYDKPTSVQKYAIPIIQSGRNLIACSETGCGKTAAYVLPIMNEVLRRKITPRPGCPQNPCALIIAPTKELADQIDKDIRMFGVFAPVSNRSCMGKQGFEREAAEICRGTTILTATPGNLMKCFSRGKIGARDLRYVVLDEADKLLDDNFIEDMERIFNIVEESKAKPQYLLLSATFPERSEKIIEKFVDNPVRLEIGDPNVANEDVEIVVLSLKRFRKKDKVLEVVEADLGANPRAKIIVFLNTKNRAKEFADHLKQEGVNVVAFHGDLEFQERRVALENFQKRNASVMVTTSLSDRGLDISSVTNVVIGDLPEDVETLIHRIGRTGRVGNSGRATILYDDGYDSLMAGRLCKLIRDSKSEMPPFLSKYCHNL